MDEDPHVEVDLKRYKKEDFRKMTWAEYDKILEALWHKVEKYSRENNTKFDAIVPILRGGAFPGGYLTYKLGMLRMLPVQYHYFFKGGDLTKIRLRRILGIPDDIKLPKKPILLLVENNMCFGLTATKAAAYLKERFPGGKILLAADSIDYSYKDFDIFEKIFWGTFSNDTKAISDDEAKKLSIDISLRIFPWETLEEEHTTVQAKQFQYVDLGQIDPRSVEK